MLAFPNAKINLGLSITEKRVDGFHSLESVFLPVPSCYDVLEILPSEKTEIKLSGRLILGNTTENLCYKAYNLLKKDFDLPPVLIHLHKILPMGAGLGGGSADGSFTLKTLSTLFNLNLSEGKLESYAQQLGSDCAFFIRNEPSFCWGKGELHEKFEVELSEKQLVLVYPDVFISTKKSFQNIRPNANRPSLKELLKNPIKSWKGLIHNDFEDSLFPKFPEISKVKEKLYDFGALYASMSGSGSTVYGIFEKEVILDFPKNYWVYQSRL